MMTGWCLLGGHQAQPLRSWLSELEQSGVKELQAFAVGLDRDFEAVRTALETSYSNGQVEGQVNRLKTIKRSMYGRAGLDLLKARVLHRTPRLAASVTKSAEDPFLSRHRHNSPGWTGAKRSPSLSSLSESSGSRGLPCG